MDWGKIKAVTFDVGGTLIKPWPSVGHVYASQAATHGVNASPDELNTRFSQAWKARRDFNYSRPEWFEIVRDTFGPVAERLPETFFPQIFDRFREADVWHVFEDVRPAIEHLARAGMRLGVISNWDDRLPPLLRTLGLHSNFDVIVVSCEVGVTKPHLQIFQTAAMRFGLRPDEILHIGDAPLEDVSGARAAGFHALHLDRKSGGTLRHLVTSGGSA